MSKLLGCCGQDIMVSEECSKKRTSIHNRIAGFSDVIGQVVQSTGGLLPSLHGLAYLFEGILCLGRVRSRPLSLDQVRS